MVEDKPSAAPPVRYLELKAALLLALLVALIGGTALYLMYARGVFEQTQRLVLLVDDSEGVRVGMDLTFSGFPIGRVRRVELSAEGSARILIDVPLQDARWLRTSSMFTLVRSLVGGATLRAYSGVLTDPPLPDGAERKVLVGDTAAELPILVAAARELIGNLNRLAAEDSALSASLDNVKTLTEKLNGPQGALGALVGNDNIDPKKIAAALDRVNALLAPLHDTTTALRVRAERAMNLRLQGGCQVPIAGYAEIDHGVLLLRGLVGKPDGSVIIRSEIAGPPANAEELGTVLAEDLLARGAGQILASLYEQQ